jgi:urease accessory protein
MPANTVSYRPAQTRQTAPMLRLETILGLATAPDIAEALHRLEHRGQVEYLTLSETDTQRHRLRALTDRGTECAIALPRHQHLSNGAVLLLEKDRAVVVRMQEVQWLTLQARDTAAALELGYFAGNMHWKVEFDGERLRIAVQAPVESYLERLAHLLSDGRAARVND